MDLACAYITLREFISCLGQYIGHTGRFYFLILCLHPLSRVSRSGLTLCSASTWRIVGVCQTAFFGFCDLLHPACGKFPRKFLYACRTRQDPWVPGFLNQTPRWSVLFATSLGVKIPLAWGYHRPVGVDQPQREGTSWVNPPSFRSVRWTLWYLCCEACITPLVGTSSGAEAPLAEINEQ